MKLLDEFKENDDPSRCPRKLGSMFSKSVIIYSKMGYIGVITHLLTIN